MVGESLVRNFTSHNIAILPSFRFVLQLCVLGVPLYGSHFGQRSLRHLCRWYRLWKAVAHGSTQVDQEDQEELNVVLPTRVCGLLSDSEIPRTVARSFVVLIRDCETWWTGASSMSPRNKKKPIRILKPLHKRTHLFL